MPIERSDPEGFPYRIGAAIWVTGRWQRGGIGFVRDGTVKGDLRLPRLLFGVLAVLLVAAKQDASRRKPWASRGFRTAAEIRSELKRLSGIDVDVDSIAKLIFRLRAKFAELRRGTQEGGDWAKQLIEFRDPLGYRIALPPSDLHLDIILGQP
jgi:hypothetical protein